MEIHVKCMHMSFVRCNVEVQGTGELKTNLNLEEVISQRA